MADDKKPEKSEGKTPAPARPDPFVEIVWFVSVVLVILYLINAIIRAITSGEIFSSGVAGSALKHLVDFFWKLVPYIKYIVISLSSLLVAWIVYLYQKVVALRKEEARLLYPVISETGKEINPQWERILKHVDSINESDWRLAILEADIMLGGMLDVMALPGETMADKLKAVEKSDFRTIDNAWEGHKIRNQIAHEGQSIIITQREAKRVIALYKTIFEEFQIV